MRLRKIDPRKIKVPEVRVKSSFDEETLAIFKKTVEEWGIETPILCFEIGEELVLVDGQNRLEQAVANGESAVDVVSRPGDMIEVLTRNVLLDNLRGKHKPTDMIRVVKSLYEDFGLDSDGIKEKMGKSRDYIERLMIISKASPIVLEALDSGAIGISVAYELSRLPHHEQQEEVLAKSTVYRLKASGVKELVDDTLAYIAQSSGEAPIVQQEPVARQRYFICEGCKGEVDSHYIRPVFLCPNCFGHVWRLGKVAEENQVGVREEGLSP